MMTEYSLDARPGLWRPSSVWIRNEGTGDIVYEGPDADAVPGLIDALIGQLSENHGAAAMVRGAGSGALKSVDEEISNQSATSDLRAMVHAGLLRQQGKKRGTFYEADAPLVDIRTRVRADRRPLDASLLFATAASTVG